MLAGTKKLLGKEYKGFCNTMINAAEEEALPISFQLDNTFGLTFQDVSDLCVDFEEDTGLKLTTHLFMCPNCKVLHAMITVDYFDDDEELGPYGLLQ